MIELFSIDRIKIVEPMERGTKVLVAVLAQIAASLFLDEPLNASLRANVKSPS